jgi:hypothetical protein
VVYYQISAPKKSKKNNLTQVKKRREKGNGGEMMEMLRSNEFSMLHGLSRESYVTLQKIYEPITLP